MTMAKQFLKFGRFTKVEAAEDGSCTVTGILTSEALDSDNERCDYATTKPYYMKWSDACSKRSHGKSLGNVREQHDAKKAAGKLIALHFDDEEKRIYGTAKIVDPTTAMKCMEGVLTGFSHLGTYVDVWKANGERWYTADPREQSVVDEPANPEAIFDVDEAVKVALSDAPLEGEFEYVAKNGSKELRKFKGSPLEKGVKYLVTDSDGKKHLPYTDESGKPDHRLMGAAWAALHGGYRGNKYEGEDKSGAIARLKRVYEREGMKPPSEKAAQLREAALTVHKAKHTGEFSACKDALCDEVRKGMWDVARLADVLQTLQILMQSSEAEAIYEGDDSEVPGQLRAWLKAGIPILEDMVSEEANELLQTGKSAGHSIEEKTGMTENANAGELEKAGKNFMKAHHLFKAKHHAAMAKAMEHHPEVAKLHKAAAEHHKDMAAACADSDEGKAAAARVQARPSEPSEAEKAAAAAAQSDLAKRAESDPVAKAVLEMKAMFEDLGKAFVKQNEVITQMLKAPEPRKTAANGNVTVTKEGDNGGAQDASKAAGNGKEPTTAELIKASFEKPTIVRPGMSA